MKEFLEDLFEFLPDAVVLVGPDGKIRRANAQAAQLFGYSREELEGLSVDELVPDARRAGHQAHRESYLSAPHLRPMGAELKLTAQRKDGTVVPVEIMLAGTPRGEVLAVVRDISVRRERERELARLREEAEIALRAREELVAIASHDVRSPLSGMRLQLLNLKRGAERAKDNPLAGWMHERVEMMMRAIDDMFELLDSLLDRQRRQSATIEFRREPTDLIEVVTRVVVRSRQQLEAVGCTVSVSAGEPIVGNWDRLRLEQVLANILNNAAKYAAGEPISVRVARAASGAAAELVVRDGGPGIPAEQQARVFELFQQGSSPREGYGVGLWIVHRLVELHGGKVRIDSAPGAGTAFVIELPLGGGA